MKALSIRQPYAWLIVHGVKPVENRDWPCNWHRGPLLIHTGKKVETADFEDINEDLAEQGLPLLPSPNEIERGGIVGCVRMVDCVTNHPSKWFYGPYAFVFDESEILPFYPCKGALGLFDVNWPPRQ